MARFDPVADRYDAFCATPLGSFVEAVERQMVAELLDPHPGERVVDLGCGRTYYTMALMRNHYTEQTFAGRERPFSLC